MLRFVICTVTNHFGFRDPERTVREEPPQNKQIYFRQMSVHQILAEEPCTATYAPLVKHRIISWVHQWLVSQEQATHQSIGKCQVWTGFSLSHGEYAKKKNLGEKQRELKQ